MTRQQRHEKEMPALTPLAVAVADTPDVAGCYQVGLQALEAKDRDRSLIDYENPNKIQGSVYLDKATEKCKHPFPKRWDYVIEYDNKIYYYEPHPASGGDKIDEVCGKADWLMWWLKNNAPKIRTLGSGPFYWIHTGKCNIDKNSQQYKKLLDKGVKLGSRLYMK